MENTRNLNVCEKDTIVRSIKNFGISTIFKTENDINRQTLDDIMRDFQLNETVFMSSIHIKNNFKKIYKYGKYSNYQKSCVFCENNHEPESIYKSHSVRDDVGKVLCPKLRKYICPTCGASGDNAHTVKYCPEKRIVTMEDTEKYERFRSMRTAYFKEKVNYIK